MVSTRRWWAFALGLLALSYGAWQLRAAWIQTWFRDGVPNHGPASTDGSRPVLAPSDRVRVVVLDGLSAEVADELPHLSQLCARGWDVRVDNGFPTVSLPVQHVLWTGLTQQQSGVLYRIPRIVPPAAVPTGESIAVAQSHRGIAHSFAFGHVEPPSDAEAIEAEGSAWRQHSFASAATYAVASDAKLAFVHVLEIDEAGHAHGRASPQYAEAAGTADAWLGEAVAAAGPDATWIVLADHGHRAEGGHGGAEADIRIVRGCLVADGLPPRDARGEAPVRLVDVSRELYAATAATVHPSTTGRSVAAALADPRPADLPRPSGMAWGIAAVLVLGGLGLALRLAGRRPSRWPWWFLIALATIPLLADAPTLSNPAVYPRVPTRLWLAASPAALVLAIVSFRDLRAQGPATTLAVQLAPAVAWVAAAFVLSVLPAVGPTTVVMPPLVPDWTAHTSVSLAVLAAAAVVLAGVVTASSRRPSPPVRSRPPSEP